MSITYDPEEKKWKITLLPLEKEKPLPHNLDKYEPIYTLFPVDDDPLKKRIPAEIYEELENDNKKIEEENEIIRKNNEPKIKENEKIEEIYKKITAIAKNTISGSYKSQRDLIRKLKTDGVIDANTLENLESNFNTFYKTEKVSPWNPDFRIKPPSPGNTKELDIEFYKTQVPKKTIEAWEEARKEGDLDYTERYLTEKDYYQWHYTQHGKPNGIRGYAKEATDLTNTYLRKPTDADRQLITDIVNLTKEEKHDPIISKESKRGRDYDARIKTILESPKEIEDTKKYGALAQNVLKDTIAELNKNKLKESQFDLYRSLEGFSEILDLNKTLANSILGDSGVGGYLARAKNKSEEDITKDLETQLEKMTGIKSNVGYNWQKWFDETLTQKYGIDYKKFESTENTLNVVNAALKTDENAIEIYDSKNKKFTNAFIQKAGFKSDAELTQFLKNQGESGLELLTNLQSGVIDREKFENNRDILKKDIAILNKQKLKLTYTEERKIPEKVEIEASFARQFIDDYLKPRFDYSRSMNEFIDYMNVSKEYKNPFQTTDRLTLVKDYGQSVAKNIQDDLQKYQHDPQKYPKAFEEKFNADFYFNPEDKNAPLEKQDRYKEQEKKVKEDWIIAKENPDADINPSNHSLGTWAQNAYLYGIDKPEELKNKETFAKLHYQLIGSQANQTGSNTAFDGAIDPSSTLKDQLENPIYAEAQRIGTVFGEFITPEKFANKILKDIDPLKNKDSWKKLIDQYNLKETASLDEVKTAITNSITLGSAEEIRENIKTLQKLEKTPTQAELGVSYIERAEDKGAEQEKTELYNIFKSQGYQGTEKEFYTDYMPGTNKEDLKLLSSISKRKNLELDLNFISPKNLRQDPEGSLSKISELFSADNSKSTTSTKRKTNSYFKIGLDDDEEENLPSSESFLSDFTSVLKK